MVLSGLIINEQDLNYKDEINSFVNWCDRNHQVLNVSETKEMVIDFRKQENDSKAIKIKEKEVERVEMFTCLGAVVDNKLTWKSNTDVIVSKIKTRMYCLMKLRSFKINPVSFKYFILQCFKLCSHLLGR